MSHAGRYQDKKYRHHQDHGSDRYKEDRRPRKPYSYNGRPTEDSRGVQHSRMSTVCSDLYSKTSGAAQEYFGPPPPECYPPKETFSMKCSKCVPFQAEHVEDDRFWPGGCLEMKFFQKETFN